MKKQWIAFQAILNKEVTRFVRIWSQTLLPPVITQMLYFLIFGKFIGSRIGNIEGVDYMAFIVPGLVMMAVINSAYVNVVSSFFSAKFQRNIEEMLVAPVSSWVIMAGYVSAGVLRGLLVGFLVFAVSCFFTRPVIHSFFMIFIFILLTAVLFSLGGLLNGIFSKNFDDVSIFPTFVLTPLIYLGGVFYSINHLPPVWQHISRLNPILYMVNGFRFGFYGLSDVNLFLSLGLLIVFIFGLILINFRLLEKGVGLKN